MYIRHFSQNESVTVSSQHLALEKTVDQAGDRRGEPLPARSLIQLVDDVCKSVGRFLSPSSH